LIRWREQITNGAKMKKLKMYNFKISVEAKHFLKIRSKVIDLIMSLTEKKIYKNKRPMMIEVLGTGRESSYLYYSSIAGWKSRKDFLKVMAARKKANQEIAAAARKKANQEIAAAGKKANQEIAA